MNTSQEAEQIRGVLIDLSDFALGKRTSPAVEPLIARLSRETAALMVMWLMGWLRDWSRSPGTLRRRNPGRPAPEAISQVVESFPILAEMLIYTNGHLEFRAAVDTDRRARVVELVAELYNPAPDVNWLPQRARIAPDR